MLAAGNNTNPEVITTLLRAGANLKALNKDGWTSLMAAVRNNGHLEVTIALLKAGADINTQDRFGETPVPMRSSGM